MLLTVPDLRSADEARQVESALARLEGIADVRTAVGARKALVAYDPDRVRPDTIRAAIRELGMTVREVPLEVKPRARPLSDIALADTMRPEVPAALEQARSLGVPRLLLLTGDQRAAAAAVANRLDLDHGADVVPEQKIRAIERLQREAHVVAMVGDGINDAPALAQADVGIAMGVVGTDAALEAAHVALMQDDWRAVPAAIAVGRRAFRVIQQNL